MVAVDVKVFKLDKVFNQHSTLLSSQCSDHFRQTVQQHNTYYFSPTFKSMQMISDFK